MNQKIIFIFCCLFLTFACQKSKNHIPNFHVHTTKDDLHREMELPVKLERIMALTPSITEILYRLVDSKKIVGRTPHCNYPHQVYLKPVVSSYPLDLERLITLKPQVVFVKDGMLALEEAEKIERSGIKVFYLKYDNCQDIVNSIDQIGKLLDQDYKAGLMADSMSKHLHNLKRVADDFHTKPKVLIMISHDPIFVFGLNNFGSDMLTYAGAQNAVSDSLTSPFPQINREYLLKINPDIIIELGKKNSKEHGLFEHYPELTQINAYKNNKLFCIQEDIVSRPGPRVIDGILALRKLIHPNEK